LFTDVTDVTVAEGTLGGSAAGALELLAEATATVGIEADGVDLVPLVVNVVVRVGLPAPEDAIGVPPDTVAAADGTAGFDTTDDVRRGAREPGVELEADDRVAEGVEESFPDVSAAAAPAVMMAAAVPIPSSTANAPTRPTFTA